MTDAALDKRPDERLRYLDGLRALAALLVLVHHAWAMVFPPQDGVVPTGALALTNWAKLGPYGVSVFIVLAGFSLTLAVAKRDGRLPRGVWTFVKRRAKRIIPPYYAAILLTLLLSLLWFNRKTGTHWDLSVPLDWKGVIANIFLLQDWVPFDVTNVAYTFWSISVEWHIYFTFPLLLVLWRRRSYLTAMSVGVALGIAGGYLSLLIPRFTNVHPDYYALFAVGMGACAIAHQKPEWSTRVPWLLVSGAGFVAWLALVAVHAPRTLAPIFDPDLAMGVAVAALLIAVSYSEGGLVHRALSWKPIARVGVFSYSLYLIHAPLLQVVWMVAVEPFHLSKAAFLAVMWIVAVPVIVAASYGFHIIAERPFMQQTARGPHAPTRSPEPIS